MSCGVTGTEAIGDSSRVLDSFLVFFFQAEDGIRDSSVTGVQTCALPICQSFLVALEFIEGNAFVVVGKSIVGVKANGLLIGNKRLVVALEVVEGNALVVEIGRASCRERV